MDFLISAEGPGTKCLRCQNQLNIKGYLFGGHCMFMRHSDTIPIVASELGTGEHQALA